MRIAIYSDNLYPELSGIVDTNLITAGELQKHGHQFLFVGPKYTKEEYEETKREYPADPAHELVRGMPVVRVPSFPLPFSPTGQSRFSIPHNASLARVREWKPDLIHVQSPWGVGLEAWRVARKLNVPLIGTNHSAVEDFFPLPFLVRRYDAWFYNRCRFISTPYQHLIDNMRSVGLRAEARVISNPAELPLFFPVSAEKKQQLRAELTLGGPVVIYSGRLAKEKRVDIVLRGAALLMKEFPALTVVLTGRGADEPRLRALAKELGMEKQVVFTGFLPMEEISRYHQAADAFAFMSTSDSQSLALMQAYAAGLPAVCARARGIPDYSPAECSFLVEPGDYAAMARHLRTLFNDEPLRERMGATATEYVKKFAPEKIAAQWEEIYKNEIDRRKSGKK